jgi:lysophospholipase L1-like esterase
MPPRVTRLMLAAAIVAAGVALLTSACNPEAASVPSSTATPSPGDTTGSPIRYVALGDSYTIGTSVTPADRWPDQLVARVPGLDLVGNLGVNGFTSRDVIDVELPQLDGLMPGFVTLLVGVNDVVRGVSPDAYRSNVALILDALVGRVGAGRVLVVTTPDYTVTPAGSDYGDPQAQSAGIRANNAILSEAAEARGIRVVDIYDISLRAATERDLVAGDGLHPSGAQYALWVDRIAPALQELLPRADPPPPTDSSLRPRS